jgi:hypothetical protein
MMRTVGRNLRTAFASRWPFIELVSVRPASSIATYEPRRWSTQAEMVSMVGEKVVAAIEAGTTLLTGGSHDQVIARYHELVADITRRLTA